MKKSTVLTLLILCILNSFIHASSDFYYDHIKSGFGIRALTMGGAYTALGEEGGGMSFNPAGMAQVGAAVAWETFDTDKDVLRLSSAQSFYASPFGISEWRTKAHSGERLNVTTYAFGRKGSHRIDWGVSYKTIKFRDEDVYENGWASDLGLLMHVTPRIKLGAVAKDVYKKKVNIPTTMVAGFAYHTSNRNFILTGDWVQNRQDPDNPFIRSRFGTEMHISDGLLIRSGFGHNVVSGGAGIIFDSFELDFGVMSDSSENQTQTQYMFGVKMGKGVQNYRHRRQYAL